MEDDVDAPDSVDLDGDVDVGRDSDDQVEEDKQEEDEEEEEEEDDGKEPRAIGQGEMVITSADDADTMVDDDSTVVPEQGQEMREHTPWAQPTVPALRPHTPEPPPPPQTPETHTLIGPEFLRIVMPRKPRPAAPTLREAVASRNSSDVDAEEQLLNQLAVGNNLPDVPLPDVPFPDVHLPVVLLRDAG